VKNPEGNNPQFVEEIEIGGARLRVESVVAVAQGAKIEDGTAVTVTYYTDAGRTAKTTLTGDLVQVRDMTAADVMFLALALIIVGTGFLKANISTVVGALYEMHDTRRDGGFTRVLGVYARDRRIVTLADAVRKMTSFPAARLGLVDRGLVRPGMKADLVVFDPDRVRDLATFEQPHQYAEGISHVLTNGQLVFENGAMTAARPGAVLYGTGRSNGRR
jgi:hypothetical protein